MRFEAREAETKQVTSCFKSRLGNGLTGAEGKLFSDGVMGGARDTAMKCEEGRLEGARASMTEVTRS